MPRGEPRSVPDLEGEMYDDWVRRQREAEERAADQASSGRWPASPAQLEARDAMSATPANLAGAALFPVLGPLFGVVDHARADEPWAAAGSAVEAAADVGMVLTGAGVAGAVEKGVANNVGRRTAEAVRKQLRRRGVAGAGQEIHHSVPLNGMRRTVENWRNHPAFLKVLPTANHRRLSGSWEGKPRFDPIRRAWIGTPDWMKTVPAWLGVQTAALGGPIATTLSDRRSNPGLPPPPW